MPTHPEQTNTCFRFELFISLIEIENRCERSLEMLKATHHTLSIIIAVLKFITICNADLLIKYRGVKYFYANFDHNHEIILPPT